MKLWRQRAKREDARQPLLPGLSAPPPTTRRVLVTPGEQALDLARKRLAFTGVMFAIIFLVIAGRLVDVMAMAEGAGEPGEPHVALTQPGGRPDIVDRNGALLATSLPTTSACAHTRQISDPETAVKQIASILPDLDRKRLLADLRGKRGCVPVRRHLTPNQHDALNRIGIPGLEFLRDERRVYPAGELTAHVVGYTDIDSLGIAGMEKTIDRMRRSDQSPVKLSLDLRLQNVLAREIGQAMQDFAAIGAAGMVMDATSGEILAMVSLPSFDPHRPGDAEDRARFNNVTLGVYEQGSTFKTFTAAMALNSGQVRITDTFETTKPLVIGREVIHDYHPAKHNMTVPEIIMESSNIGTALMAERAGADAQRQFLGRLGMFEAPRIELPETGRPLVPPAPWSRITSATIAFGHGLAVSPLQVVTGTATLANGGSPVTPTLLAKSGKNSADTRDKPVISADTAAKLRAMMRLVVSDGTAKKANVPGYLVGGKTGTADKNIGRQYSSNARRSSFIGVFPLNKPRYIVYAMLDEPKGNKSTYGFATGGWVAAPAVGRIIAEAGPLLGVTPLTPEEEQAAEAAVLRPLGQVILNALHTKTRNDQIATVESAGEN